MLIGTLGAFVTRYAGLVSLVLVLSFTSAVASLYLPTLNAALIDHGLLNGDIHFIWRTGAWMLAVSGLQGLCAICSVYFGAKAAMSFGRDLRGEIFGRVLTFAGRELSGFGLSTLIVRNTNDVQQVQIVALMSCTVLVSAPVTVIGGITMAVHEDLGLSWLIVVSIPVLAVPICGIILKMAPLFRVMQGRIDALNRVLRDQLSGIRVVRAFVREPHEQARFARANADVTAVATSTGQMMVAFFPLVMLIINVFSVAVLWLGAGRIAAGHLQIGSMMAFLIYLIQVLMSVVTATVLLILLPRAAASANRIHEVLRTQPSVMAPLRTTKISAKASTVEVRCAQLTYPGVGLPTLRDVSFVARPGETTAIIGATGAGKSTLISLILRLFDVTGGKVLIDGVDVRCLDPDVLRGKVGLVPQEAYLFSGTVASNLRFGRLAATDADLWHALDVAQASDFVRAMPGELGAIISQGGSNLSGGQRQRLAIARALVAQRGIYIFDDSFSSLDVATDVRLRSALKAETRQAVVIIVSQRVATIAGADHIVVLEDGHVVGDGSHAALLAECSTYREIVESQRIMEDAP